MNDSFSRDFTDQIYREPNSEESSKIRDYIERDLKEISKELDRLLSGIGLKENRDFILEMTGKKTVPHWYGSLIEGNRPDLQNVKAIGTMIEYLFVCAIDKLVIKKYFKKTDLRVFPNPSRGIDLPSLNIDIKAPGKRLDRGPGTSTRAHSPFERIFGLDYHCVILHTNLKTELTGPLRILRSAYLRPSQMADTTLSGICKEYRSRLLDEKSPLFHRLFFNKKQEKKFIDLCVFLTFCRRDSKHCNDLIMKLKEIITISDSKQFFSRFDEAIKKCNDWIEQEDGRNFSLRRPSDKEIEKLKFDDIGGKVTVSFKNELFLQFRQLLETIPENTE